MLEYIVIKSSEDIYFSCVVGRILYSLSNNTYIGMRESDHIYVYVVEGVLVREGFGEDVELLSKFADDKEGITYRADIIKAYKDKRKHYESN